MGPALPPRHQDGQRFSIHHREAIWGARSLARLPRHADQAWPLALHGELATDVTVSALPLLPRMEILEIRGLVRGDVLAALGIQPMLRIVRIDTNGDEQELHLSPRL